MAIFKRGRVYWFEFLYNGERIRKSTRQQNARAAKDIAAAYRTALAKGEAGIERRPKIPTLREFHSPFLREIQTRRADRPATIEFYTYKLAALLQFAPLASARLDAINEALIARFVQWRSRKSKPATVNRCLATLRRLLRLARKWEMIQRVPTIELLQGERQRDFVLSTKQQDIYIEVCPEPLKSVARFALATGMRLGEILALRWDDVHLDPLGSARRGHIRIRQGKSQNAKRTISLTAGARAVLVCQQMKSQSDYVFARDDQSGPLSRSTLAHQHGRVRRRMQEISTRRRKGKSYSEIAEGFGISAAEVSRISALAWPSDFVIHSFRHAMLTRLGEMGVDAFTIMRIAGHSSITVSQRYVHPTPETQERAFDRLEEQEKVPTEVPTAEEAKVETIQ